jgi:hypothetical protein
MLAMVSHAFAGDGKKDKESQGDSTIISKDSAVKLIKAQLQVDDTLVYDDWEREDGDIATNKGSVIVGLENDFSKSDNSQTSQTWSNLIVDQLKKDKKYKVDFTVYPNPTASSISIKAKYPSNSIRIIDLLGNEIKREGFTNKLDVSDLNAGTYFIQLMYEDYSQSLKFIKTN